MCATALAKYTSAMFLLPSSVSELPPGSHPAAAALHPALRPPTSFPGPFPAPHFLPSPFHSVDINALQQHIPPKSIIPLAGMAGIMMPWL